MADINLRAAWDSIKGKFDRTPAAAAEPVAEPAPVAGTQSLRQIGPAPGDAAASTARPISLRAADPATFQMPAEPGPAGQGVLRPNGGFGMANPGGPSNEFPVLRDVLKPGNVPMPPAASPPPFEGVPKSPILVGGQSPQAAAWQAERVATPKPGPGLQPGDWVKPGASAAPPAAPPGNSGLGSVIGTRAEWGKTADSFMSGLAKAGSAAKTVAGGASKYLLKPAAPVLGAIETVQGLREGDMGKAGVGAVDTAAGVGLYTPAAPVAAAYLGVRGAYELGQKLPESWRDNIGSTVNSGVRGLGKLVGQDWGEDDTNLRAQQQAAAAPAAAPTVAELPVDRTLDDRPRGSVADSIANQMAKDEATPIAPPPEAAQPEQTLREPDRSPGAIAWSAFGGGNTQYATNDGRTITAPDKASDADREMMQRMSIVDTDQPEGAKFEQDGKQYISSRAGTNSMGQPTFKGMSIDGKGVHESDWNHRTSMYNAARDRVNGLGPEDQLAIASFAERDLRSQERQQQPQSQALGGQPANAKVAAFQQQYGGAAEKAGRALGVDPNLLLAKWGNETGWGKSIIPGTNNLGNIKDPSGRGVRATDSMTGSRDTYRKFDTPEAFADHYVGLMQRKYPGVVGAGGDAEKFTAALKGYAEDPNYGAKVKGAYGMLGGQAGASQAQPESLSDRSTRVINGDGTSYYEVPDGHGSYMAITSDQFHSGLRHKGGLDASLQEQYDASRKGNLDVYYPKGIEREKLAAQTAETRALREQTAAMNQASLRNIEQDNIRADSAARDAASKSLDNHLGSVLTKDDGKGNAVPDVARVGAANRAMHDEVGMYIQDLQRQFPAGSAGHSKAQQYIRKLSTQGVAALEPDDRARMLSQFQIMERAMQTESPFLGGSSPVKSRLSGYAVNPDPQVIARNKRLFGSDIVELMNGTKIRANDLKYTESGNHLWPNIRHVPTTDFDTGLRGQ